MPKYEVTNVYANEAGLWRAEVRFNWPKSSTETRAEYHTSHAVDYSRRLARTAIVNAIAEREQKTGETWEAAVKRVRASLPPLAIIKLNQGASTNLDYGVTLGEPNA